MNAQRWRPIDDEAKNGLARLIWSPHYGAYEASYNVTGDFWVQRFGTVTLAEQVTAWMPLPEPPKNG